MESPVSSGRLSSYRADLIVLGVLVCAVVLAFGIPSALGFPLMPSDDLTQNFPLRVLAARDLAHGSLPLWNPFMWSGTPLLGGMNAGAFYPSMLLFMILPPLTAWTFDMILVYLVAVGGMYLLARYFRLPAIPAALASMSFAFMGAMNMEMRHIGMVEGFAWLPWFALGIEGTFRGVRRRAAALQEGSAGEGWSGTPSAVAGSGAAMCEVNYRRVMDLFRTQRLIPWGGIVLTGFALAMGILTGSPTALEKFPIVAAVVVIWHLARPGDLPSARTRITFLVLVGLAFAWGTAIGSAQLLPGLAFHAISQRAHGGSGTYSFGWLSLPPGGWLLLFLPGATGGTGSFSLAHVNGPFPEFSGYPGLLALVGCFGLLSRSFGRRRDPAASRWMMWMVMVAAGVVLAMGTELPTGFIFAHLPLFGSSRAQSENMVIVNLGLAMLLGCWAERIIGFTRSSRKVRAGSARPAGGAGAAARWRSQRDTDVVVRPAVDLAETVACGFPIAVVAIAAFATAIDPKEIARVAGMTPLPGSLPVDKLWPLVAITVVIAVAVAATVISLRFRISRRFMPAVLTVIMAVDVVSFAALFSEAFNFAGFNPSQMINQVEPASFAQVVNVSGHSAPRPATRRVSFFKAVAGPGIAAPGYLQPDVNVVSRVPSVNGYSAMVWSGYEAATCAHAFDLLKTGILPSKAVDQLDLGTLATSSEAFTSSVGLFSAVSASTLAKGGSVVEGAPRPASPGNNNGQSCPESEFKGIAPAPPSVVSGGSGVSVEWYSGSPKRVFRVMVRIPKGMSFPGKGGGAGGSTTVTVELLAPSGGTSGNLRVVASGRMEPATLDIYPTHPEGSTQPAAGPASASGRMQRLPVLATDFAKPKVAVAVRFVMTSGSAAQLQNLIRAGNVELVNTRGETSNLTGPLVNAIRPGQWSFAGSNGTFTVYRNNDATGHVWLSGTGRLGVVDAPARDALASVVSMSDAGRETDRVTTPGRALLVRSEAWAPGWTATIRTAGGRVTREKVARHGVIQAVAVPAGQSTVTFTYWPPGMTRGVALTLLGLALLALVGIAEAFGLVRRQRRR